MTEPAMDLATVLVLVLGLLFFGGIAFLAWKERKKEGSESKRDEPVAPPVDSRREEPRRRKRRAG
jgi:hypothetical protein